MSKVEVEPVELGEEALNSIVAETSKAIQPEIEKAVTDAVAGETLTKKIEEAVEEAGKSILDKYLEKTEDIERKAIEKAKKEAAGESEVAKGLEANDFSEEISKWSPARRFFEQVRALDDENGNRKLLKQLNKFALASQMDARRELEKEKGFAAVSRSGYANETTAADGAVLVPDAEFVTEVFDNLPTYGVVFKYGDVRQTDRTAVRVLTLDTGLTFYATAEAGVKTGAKMDFAKNEVSLQKFAVIVPATDELSDDAAIDYWNLVTRELTRAYAKKADELVFTDATYGITNQSGVLTQTMGADDGVITWDDIFNAEAKTEDGLDESNFRWFMRKQTWLKLVQQRAGSGYGDDDGKGAYLIGSLNQGIGWKADLRNPTTPWGTEVVFTRVLPKLADVSDNDGVAVYGDLRNTLFYNKRGMALKMLTEATVVDADDNDLNLATQDASAMRAVIRMLHILPKGNRTKFVVIGPGTVS